MPKPPVVLAIFLHCMDVASEDRKHIYIRSNCGEVPNLLGPVTIVRDAEVCQGKRGPPFPPERASTQPLVGPVIRWGSGSVVHTMILHRCLWPLLAQMRSFERFPHHRDAFFSYVRA